jgi:HK97 family phage prohead protease
MPSTMGLRAPEVRTYPARLSTIDTDTLTELHGLAVPYGVEANTGQEIESWAPGALASAVEAARGLPLLMWHNNRSWAIGVSAGWAEEDDGLYGVWRLDEHPDAQRAARQAQDGYMTGLSVGFQPIRSEWTYASWEDWDPNDPATFDRVVRLEARLVEVSLTPTPVYADAGVTLVRSAERRRTARRPARPAGAMTRTGVDAPRLAAASSQTSMPAHRTVRSGATPHLDVWRAWRGTV